MTRLFGKVRLGAGILLVVLGLTAATAVPASAYQPVDIVHTEHVQAGPYAMTVGFTTWPVRAMQSLDFTFMPDTGIADKSGTVATLGPGQKLMRSQPLSRHPRKRDVWGWDVLSLPSQGTWTLKFHLDGPQGPGDGELTNLAVLPQPGPPLTLSWAISTLPLIGLITFIVIAWRRTRATLTAAPPATTS